MKLSISNIIWEKGKHNLEEFLSIVSRSELKGVELAPSCFWLEPADVSNYEIDWLRGLLSIYNLQVSALHSVTYTREDLELFGSQEKLIELIDYIKKYIEIARKLGCSNIVFGSPKSRKTHGRSKEKCNEIFKHFLTRIDQESDGVYINIEPLHKDTCEYINYFEEASSLIEDQGYKNIKIQLDVRSVIENEERPGLIEEYRNNIVHCQVSDPGLCIPVEVHAHTHRFVRDKLEAMNYQGFIAGEIINPGKVEKIAYLNKAIDQLKYFYA